MSIFLLIINFDLVGSAFFKKKCRGEVERFATGLNNNEIPLLQASPRTPSTAGGALIQCDDVAMANFRQMKRPH